MDLVRCLISFDLSVLPYRPFDSFESVLDIHRFSAVLIRYVAHSADGGVLCRCPPIGKTDPAGGMAANARAPDVISHAVPVGRFALRTAVRQGVRCTSSRVQRLDACGNALRSVSVDYQLLCAAGSESRINGVALAALFRSPRDWRHGSLHCGAVAGELCPWARLRH